MPLCTDQSDAQATRTLSPSLVEGVEAAYLITRARSWNIVAASPELREASGATRQTLDHPMTWPRFYVFLITPGLN
jgi:hypothetical protein